LFLLPRERFVTADDLIAAITPRTRLVSVSMVRYDDGSLLDARGALPMRAINRERCFCWRASQSCGAIPLDVNQLGADFIVSAGYSGCWSIRHGILLGQARASQIIRPDHSIGWRWRASGQFRSVNFEDPKPAATRREVDSPEWASYF